MCVVSPAVLDGYFKLPDRAADGIDLSDGVGGRLPTAITCKSSWLYTSHGGILRVKPDMNTWVRLCNVLLRWVDVLCVTSSGRASARTPLLSSVPQG